jgi:hypothetical protein
MVNNAGSNQQYTRSSYNTDAVFHIIMDHEKFFFGKTGTVYGFFI